MMTNKPYLILVILVLLLCQVGSSTIAVQAQPDQRNGASIVNRLADQPVDQISRSLAYPANTDFFIYLPIVMRNYCPDFFDDFSNPASGWYIGDDAYLKAEYLNGEYRTLVKQVDWMFWFGAPTCNREDYKVEVNARWAGNSGTGYGLLFGVKGNFERFYMFLVNTDYQDYLLLRYGPEGWTVIRSWSYNSTINPGTSVNQLGVIRDGSTIRLIINGSWFYPPNDSAITGATGIGLVVVSYVDLPNADARFDNFRVTGLESMTLTLNSDQKDMQGLTQPTGKAYEGMELPDIVFQRGK